jgi:hypothetical protein
LVREPDLDLDRVGVLALRAPHGCLPRGGHARTVLL